MDASSHSVSVPCRLMCAASSMIPSAAGRSSSVRSGPSPDGLEVIGRVLSLLLVEHRQRTAAAPPGQHDLLVAQPVLGVLDALAEILDHLLHQQRRVGAAESAVAVDDMMAGPGQSR